MRITVNDAFVDPSVIRDAGAVAAADLGSALEQADIVSVHIPRATGTPLLGAPELARMKPSSMVINTARGGLIDEDALDAALRAGRLGGAGLDVLDIEPPQPHHPLLSNERVLITPHAAGLTEECAMRTSAAAAQNILDYFAGTLDPALVVNQDHVSLVPKAPIHA